VTKSRKSSTNRKTQTDPRKQPESNKQQLVALIFVSVVFAPEFNKQVQHFPSNRFRARMRGLCLNTTSTYPKKNGIAYDRYSAQQITFDDFERASSQRRFKQIRRLFASSGTGRR
jgi:hypothetical protein